MSLTCGDCGDGPFATKRDLVQHAVTTHTGERSPYEIVHGRGPLGDLEKTAEEDKDK